MSCFIRPNLLLTIHGLLNILNINRILYRILNNNKQIETYHTFSLLISYSFTNLKRWGNLRDAFSKSKRKLKEWKKSESGVRTLRSTSTRTKCNF